jgi:predicted RNA-binding Zn-ribbon protein involved in translation (DUF1610 family)
MTRIDGGEAHREWWRHVNNSVLFISLVCSHTREPSVGRFVWTGSAYTLVAASRQRPGSVIPGENQQQRIDAAFGTAEDYPGCPGCGADGFVRCGQCRKLGCWDDSWELFTCPRCGNSGRVTGEIDHLSDLGTG